MPHRIDPTKISDISQARTAVKAALARLDQIVAGIDGATTAQTKTAIKDMAVYLKHIIKVIT